MGAEHLPRPSAGALDLGLDLGNGKTVRPWIQYGSAATTIMHVSVCTFWVVCRSFLFNGCFYNMLQDVSKFRYGLLWFAVIAWYQFMACGDLT